MKLSKFGNNDRCRQYSPDQFRPWGSFQNWTSRHKVRLPLGLTNQRKLHYYGWENPSKFWGLLGRLNNAFYALNLLSTCWLYYRYERGWIYFCLYYHPANWELHSWFTHSARGWMGKGRPFTQPYSALNKINKTYVPTFSARHNFSFYERKTISLKKKNPQFNITDISKNLLPAFEIQEEPQSLYCFESGWEKLLYQEYTYVLGASLPLSRFTISGYCSAN